MKLEGNVMLITGGASGIGLGLARAFKARGNEVIVAGRSRAKLDQAAAHGLVTKTLDIADAEGVRAFAASLVREHPQLNVVIHAAGIMKNENLRRPQATSDVVEETIATNFLGPLRLNEVLIPHFLKLPRATVMTVTSGLASVPLAMTPTYSATKAAMLSYGLSLRYQLRETPVEVIELAPPYVATSLMGDRQAQDPTAMPLDEFIAEVMGILEREPDVTEVLVKRVEAQRFAAHGGREVYRQFFTKMNDMITAARTKEITP